MAHLFLHFKDFMTLNTFFLLLSISYFFFSSLKRINCMGMVLIGIDLYRFLAPVVQES